MSSFEKVSPGMIPRFLSQKIEQKLYSTSKSFAFQVSDENRSMLQETQQAIRNRDAIVTVFDEVLLIASAELSYLPEKKMPSTTAKATSRSANEALLHVQRSFVT